MLRWRGGRAVPVGGLRARARARAGARSLLERAARRAAAGPEPRPRSSVLGPRESRGTLDLELHARWTLVAARGARALQFYHNHEVESRVWLAGTQTHSH